MHFNFENLENPYRQPVQPKASRHHPGGIRKRRAGSTTGSQPESAASRFNTELKYRETVKRIKRATDAAELEGPILPDDLSERVDMPPTLVRDQVSALLSLLLISLRGLDIA